MKLCLQAGLWGFDRGHFDPASLNMVRSAKIPSANLSDTYIIIGINQVKIKWCGERVRKATWPVKGRGNRDATQGAYLADHFLATCVVPYGASRVIRGMLRDQ